MYTEEKAPSYIQNHIISYNTESPWSWFSCTINLMKSICDDTIKFGEAVDDTFVIHWITSFAVKETYANKVALDLEYDCLMEGCLYTEQKDTLKVDVENILVFNANHLNYAFIYDDYLNGRLNFYSDLIIIVR